MLDHQVSCFRHPEALQRHHGAEQFPKVGHRQGRQDLGLPVGEPPLGVTRIGLGPLLFGWGDKPGGQHGQRQRRFPGAVLLGLQFIPAELGFGLRGGACDAVALALPPRELG